VACDWGEVVTR